MTTLVETGNSNSLTLEQAAEDHPEKLDAGMRARGLMTVRAGAKAAKRILYRTIAVALVLAIVVIGAGGYYAYSTRSTGYLNDYRTCEMDVGGYSLTGTRTYSYPFTDVLGWRSIDKSRIIEKTLIDVRGTGMVIVSSKGSEQPVVTIVSEGERGTAALKPADSYTFIINKKAAAISHAALCK